MEAWFSFLNCSACPAGTNAVSQLRRGVFPATVAIFVDKICFNCVTDVCMSDANQRTLPVREVSNISLRLARDLVEGEEACCFC